MLFVVSTGLLNLPPQPFLPLPHAVPDQKGSSHCPSSQWTAQLETHAALNYTESLLFHTLLGSGLAQNLRHRLFELM